MHPRQSTSPIFEEIGEIWTVGVVNLVVLASVLKATTKKRSSTFSRKKSAPHLAMPVSRSGKWLMQKD